MLKERNISIYYKHAYFDLIFIFLSFLLALLKAPSLIIPFICVSTVYIC